MPSRESELWDSIANAVLDGNQELVAELVSDLPYGHVLANLVASAINSRMAFGDILHGNNPQVGAQSFEPTGDKNG